MFKWKLRACRVQAGYTQKEVAEKLGISEVSVVSYETGKYSPSMEIGQKLSELYGIPLEVMDFTKIGNQTVKEW